MRSGNAPMTVIRPGALLTLLAAVLCSAAPAALSKLPREFFPFTTLVVSTLPDAAAGVVLPAEIAHYNSGPVLHIRAMVSYCEFLNQGEDVKIVWQKIFFLILLRT